MGDMVIMKKLFPVLFVVMLILLNASAFAEKDESPSMEMDVAYQYMVLEDRYSAIVTLTINKGAGSRRIDYAENVRVRVTGENGIMLDKESFSLGMTSGTEFQVNFRLENPNPGYGGDPNHPPRIQIIIDTDNCGALDYECTFDVTPEARAILMCFDDRFQNSVTCFEQLWDSSYYAGRKVQTYKAIGPYASVDAMLDYMDENYGEPDANDITYIYIGTHGGKNGQFVCDMAGNRMAQNAFINNLVNRWKGRICILLDCCYSENMVKPVENMTAENAERVVVMSSTDDRKTVTIGVFSSKVKATATMFELFGKKTITVNDMYQKIKNILPAWSKGIDTELEKNLAYYEGAAYVLFGDAQMDGNGDIPLFMFDQNDSAVDYIPLVIDDGWLFMSALCSVSGIIEDAETGEPVAALCNIMKDGEFYEQRKCKADGSFSIGILPEGEYELTFFAEGYEETTLTEMLWAGDNKVFLDPIEMKPLEDFNSSQIYALALGRQSSMSDGEGCYYSITVYCVDEKGHLLLNAYGKPVSWGVSTFNSSLTKPEHFHMRVWLLDHRYVVLETADPTESGERKVEYQILGLDENGNLIALASAKTDGQGGPVFCYTGYEISRTFDSLAEDTEALKEFFLPYGIDFSGVTDQVISYNDRDNPEAAIQYRRIVMPDDIPAVLFFDTDEPGAYELLPGETEVVDRMYQPAEVREEAGQAESSSGSAENAETFIAEIKEVFPDLTLTSTTKNPGAGTWTEEYTTDDGCILTVTADAATGAVRAVRFDDSGLYGYGSQAQYNSFDSVVWNSSPSMQAAVNLIARSEAVALDQSVRDEICDTDFASLFQTEKDMVGNETRKGAQVFNGVSVEVYKYRQRAGAEYVSSYILFTFE